jgi:DNA-binding response OmpR family regulator
MGNPARILVVDDDKGIRNSLAAILKDEGYTVDVAMSGSEAIKKTETAVYNVALIDIRLPDMQGTEILRRMRDTVPKTRKIILTGYPSMQNAIEALNRRADAYILKTVTAEKLLATIREQLKLQETERKYSEQKVAEFIKTRVNETIDTVREKLQEIEREF